MLALIVTYTKVMVIKIDFPMSCSSTIVFVLFISLYVRSISNIIHQIITEYLHLSKRIMNINMKPDDKADIDKKISNF